MEAGVHVQEEVPCCWDPEEGPSWSSWVGSCFHQGFPPRCPGTLDVAWAPTLAAEEGGLLEGPLDPVPPDRLMTAEASVTQIRMLAALKPGSMPDGHALAYIFTASDTLMAGTLNRNICRKRIFCKIPSPTCQAVWQSCQGFGLQQTQTWEQPLEFSETSSKEKCTALELA